MKITIDWVRELKFPFIRITRNKPYIRPKNSVRITPPLNAGGAHPDEQIDWAFDMMERDGLDYQTIWRLYLARFYPDDDKLKYDKAKYKVFTRNLRRRKKKLEGS